MRALAWIGTGLFLGAATAPPPIVTDLKPIAIRGGVNRIPGFLPNGGTATIVQGWVGNGNAHGHYTWMVLGGRSEGESGGLVTFVSSDRDRGDGETIRASPFDGERVTGRVRFVTGRIDGRPASLAIKGWLVDNSPSGAIADHETASIHWYRLIHHPDETIDSDAFVEISSIQTTRRYCNVDLALRDTAGVPLPTDFAGANPIDGCFPDHK